MSIHDELLGADLVEHRIRHSQVFILVIYIFIKNYIHHEIEYIYFLDWNK